MRRAALVVAAGAVVAVALSGCGGVAKMPLPQASASQTALPDVEGDAPEATVDPRCVERYGAKAGLVYEGDIRVRPDGFPTAPEFGVLCWIETFSDTHQAGHYATSYYTSYEKVLGYYEGAATAGASGRADSTEGVLLTGVFGDTSYYVVESGASGYTVHWAWDGYYDH